MRFRGHRVKVKSTATHVSWKAVNQAVGCCVDRRKLARRVPFDEVLSAVALNKQAGCCYARDHSFVIHTFSRPGAGDPNTWRPEEYVLTAPGGDAVREWVALINGRLAALRDRPRNLLVYVNPFSGAGRARHVWERVAAPIFQRARVAVTVVDTAKMDHAKEMVELMKAEELAGYQGVVAVGGDGLFQEVVAGLLARRARGDVTAHRIRVGHIPAGSTDAVAYTLHGARCAATATLHIALGDRLSLDAGRMTAADGTVRHFVCQAGYGFMGDVMRFSERLRFMGPVRYDVTGALQLLRGASYRVALAYREATSTTADVQQLCTSQCEVCRLAGIRMDGPHGAYHRSATTSALHCGGAAAAHTPGGAPGTPLGGASPHAHAHAAPPPGTPAAGHGHGHGHSHGLVASASAGASLGTPPAHRYAPAPLPVSSVGPGGGASGAATADATPLQPGTPVHGGHGGGQGASGAAAAQAWQAQAMGLFTSATAGWFTPYAHAGANPAAGGAAAGGGGAGAGPLGVGSGSVHSASGHGAGDAAAGGQAAGPAQPAAAAGLGQPPPALTSGALATGGSGIGGGGQGQGLVRAPSAPLSWGQQHLQHLAGPSSQDHSTGPLHTAPAHAGAAPAAAGAPAAGSVGASFLRSGGAGGAGSACGGSPRAPSSLTGYATASAAAAAAAAAAPEPLQPPSLSSNSVPVTAMTAAAAAGGGGGSAAGTPSGAAPPPAQPLHSSGVPASGPGGSSGDGGGGGGSSGLCTAPVVDAEGWTHLEGEFASIMCVVTPCRSDKSRRGIIPNGHLCDGRMYLVLVSKCAHPNFLRFLIRLSARGLVDRCLPHVRVVPITALRVSPLPGGHYLGGCLWDAAAPESAWNVDGELLHCADVSVDVVRGAVEVFARGPETPAAARQHH
ncbi:hypothetical protein HXX76_008819 [Chlamydomonas incerta]|uniref:DAGKc domain-containing protein n=1 Tax=Chlamydomonas incerta TaxID=51695 RepID=A0A835SSN2_CHLIN|nr:hypothetical protein HXX76_008819 [Chlamydomonas incerta]|eukprot:KAG2432474.1 hypothetical protein HXX76_008819 [Chlamydomonas incerta]